MAKKRSRKITPKKLDQMWRAFCEKQALRHVAKKCRVSATTVRKYRREEKWDKRLEAIQAKARDAQDETELDRRKQDIETGMFLQQQGREFLESNGIKHDKVAVHAIISGVRMIREALGEAGEVGKIILEVVEREGK